MIYTVTCNPSLDYYVEADEIIFGEMNRTNAENVVVGGKGINVSIVLANLGHASKTMGFVAGQIGQTILKMLEEKGIKSDMVKLADDNSRINIKLYTNNSETQINGQGPKISGQEKEYFLRKLDALQDGDLLVLSGSVQTSLGNTFYGEVLDRLQGKDVRTVVDASGKLLTFACQYHPFLVKPNREELEQIFQITIRDKKDAARQGKRLLEMGAQNVIVSLGGDGAVLLTKEGTIRFADAPRQKVIHTIGAGDSLVAGFLAGIIENDDMRHAFRLGVAAGSASAFSAELATKQDVEQIYNQVQITE